MGTLYNTFIFKLFFVFSIIKYDFLSNGSVKGPVNLAKL